MRYRKKKIETFEAIQFDPTHYPWPRCVNPWSNEPVQPRDMSWGYVRVGDSGRVHVQAGDWIINPGIERALTVCSNEDFVYIFEPADDASNG
jgi:hypothetical protein